MNEVNINGMVPATILPMDKDFNPDYRSFRDYLEWLITQNALGFAVNMDTGEGPQLSMQERLEVVRVAAEVSKGRYPVLAGLMGGWTGDAVALAKQYAESGADALVVFPNAAFRNLPLDPRIVINYHRDIADASGLPIVLFQLAPVFGGVNFTRETLLELLKLPQVIGLKEASFDAQIFTSTVETIKISKRQITILSGNDRFITETFLLGATGALLGFAAIGCKLVAEQIAAIHSKDHQRVLDLAPLIRNFADYIYRDPVLDYRARCKAGLARLHVIDQSKIFVRPPLLTVQDEEFSTMDEVLHNAGML